MRKKRLAAVIVCVLAIAAALTAWWVNRPVLPAEVRQLVKDFNDAMLVDPEIAVEYVHFENPFFRKLFVEAGVQVKAYQVEAAEKINDNLYSFTILCTNNDAIGTTKQAYNFAALIDGKWWYITGVSHIPQNLRENLDESKYVYEDENVIDIGDVYTMPLEC